jgi:acetyl-CoA synthetase
MVAALLGDEPSRLFDVPRIRDVEVVRGLLELHGVKISDGDEDGELILDPESDPTFFLRYLGEGLPAGPWHTGDRVREEDGYFYFEGRADDVIISAGYRIGPFEVESACIEHPAVAESAAVASPDERRGDVVKAFIVLAPGNEPSDELAKDIQAFVRQRLSTYAYPRLVEFVDVLPKTLTGKIRRIELREAERARAGQPA